MTSYDSARRGKLGSGVRRAGFAGYCLIAASALLLAIEGVARLALDEIPNPLFADRALGRADRPFVAADPRRGFALAPGFADRAYRINSDGFRGPELPPRDALSRRFVVLAVGDSATFGWKVAEGGPYPAQLEVFLRERGARGVLVVNAGVPSYSSSQIRASLDAVLSGARVAPDLVLVNALWNDLFASMLPRWDPDMLVARPPSPWRATLLSHSRLLRRLALGITRPVARDVFRPQALALYAQNLDAMIELARARGVEIAFVLPGFSADKLAPPRASAVQFTVPFFLSLRDRYLAAMAEVAQRHGVRVLHHRLADAAVDAAWFRDPVHPTMLGYRVMAEDLAAALIDGGVIPASALAGPNNTTAL